MALPIYRYPLDPTGKNRDNFIDREPHTLTPKARVTDVRVFSPLYGPFFAASVVIIDKVDGRTLTPDVDYVCSDLLQDPSLKFAQEISQFVVVKNGMVSNNLEVSYQVLGGNYQNDSTAVIHVFETYLNDGRAVDWDDITGKPPGFPPSPHIHMLDDIIGWGPVIVALERVRDAILMSNTATFENFLEWFKKRDVEWKQIVNTPTTLDGYGITDAVHKTRRIRTINGIQGGGTLEQDLTLSLTLTGVTPGRYGRRSYYPSIIVDDRGRITLASEFAINFSDILEKPTTLEGYGITDAVNLWGTQEITGQKTFTKTIIQTSDPGVNAVDAYRAADKEYGAFWRMENKRFWLLLTNAGDQFGNNNAFRPFWIDMVTGEVHLDTKVYASVGIEGNASTASKLRTPVKLSMAGGATAVPKNFDGSADFAFDVTALDVSKVNAGVLQGLNGGTGMSNFEVGAYFLAKTPTVMYQATAQQLMDDVGKGRKIIAGDGLTGGGNLGADVTLKLATPGTLSGSTANAVTVAGHTHQLSAATTTVAGVVRKATDQEVKDKTGDGVVMPSQLKDIVPWSTTMPIRDGGTSKPFSYVGTPGVLQTAARGDHTHPSDLKLRGNHNGGVIVNEGNYRRIDVTEVGMFLICFTGAQIELPHPNLFTIEDAGLTVRAYVHGYNTNARVTVPMGYAGSGPETYTFFSTIAIVLVRRQDGQMGWFTTDDGHTIFSDTQSSNYMSFTYTRLGNPAWGHIVGPYGMIGHTSGGVYEGDHSVNWGPWGAAWFRNVGVRAFVNIAGDSSSSYVANVTSLSRSGLSYNIKKVAGPGSFNLTASILAFGC